MEADRPLNFLWLYLRLDITRTIADGHGKIGLFTTRRATFVSSLIQSRIENEERKRRMAEHLLKRGVPKLFQVITRFNLCDLSEGVSDMSALRLLLENGVQIRGIRNLHANCTCLVRVA